ncbi:uncharacterized protein LOC128569958 isoform X3 [Nycticebus coucang]|uniref:uncharacterized protein LOC128569958 isoform X3 n=1 Tax=Nycticebus coucang TaxID=9470 RepID=UPI00234D1BBD|nr:uncharacterized protein LOC128569958 isoform X3 [Nycticebus coucang]
MVETNPSWCPVLRKVDLSGLSLRTRPNLINSTFRILAWCHTCTLTLPLRGEPGPSELNRSSQESPAPWMGQLLLQAAAWTQISSPQAALFLCACRIRCPVPNSRRRSSMTSSGLSAIGWADPAGRTLFPVARKLTLT